MILTLKSVGSFGLILICTHQDIMVSDEHSIPASWCFEWRVMKCQLCLNLYHRVSYIITTLSVQGPPSHEGLSHREYIQWNKHDKLLYFGQFNTHFSVTLNFMAACYVFVIFFCCTTLSLDRASYKQLIFKQNVPIATQQAQCSISPLTGVKDE